MVCAPPGYAIIGAGRAMDLELYGGCAVWYARCDGIGMDDARRDEKRRNGLAFENGKDTRLVPRPKLKYSTIRGFMGLG
jgi:hypothetical protein